MTADALRALLERLEKAEGPSRGLDMDLGNTLGEPMIPRYSASLDAAVALCARVHPTGLWSVLVFQHEPSTVYLAEVDGLCLWEGQDFDGKASTPALALCIAVVKAKLAEQPRCMT